MGNAKSYLTHLIVFAALFSFPACAIASSGISFSVNPQGIADISDNGTDYTPVQNPDTIVSTILFQTPGGTQEPYGFLTGSLGSVNIPDAIDSATTTATSSSFQQIYRSGQSDSFTLKMTLATTSAQTLEASISITNNDATDTLEQFGLESFLGNQFIVPGSIDSEQCPTCNFFVGSTNANALPVAFLHGSWGSVAFYTDNYGGNASSSLFNSATFTIGTTSSSFIFALENYSTPGGSASNTIEDSIGPGQTYTYHLYMTFGSSTDTSQTLAPTAYTAFDQAEPFLINWPNRRPIADLFIASGNLATSTFDPRGFEVANSPIDISNIANFDSTILGQVQNTINTMNSTVPRPQGILIWDLEGEEFDQYFTYVGYPNMLPYMAPEMDQLSDQIFSMFKNAGYEVGMTLRPGNFQVGTSEPATCTNGGSNVDLDDIFIQTNAVSPYRGYTCTAANTWTQGGANLPFHQHSPQDDATLLADMEAKVTYAQNRWGATIFYVDSTVYSDNGGGGSFNYQIFRSLQKAFPNDLFFPENTDPYFYGATVPYTGDDASTVDTSAAIRYIYPNAFSMINIAESDFVDDFNALVTSAENKNIFLFRGWFADPQTASMEQVYASSTATFQPFLVTSAASSTATTTATLNGTIGDNGGVTSTTRGFVYGLTTAYTATTTQSGSFGTGNYSAGISGLSCGTTYHYAAYAVNSAGTGYGNDQTLTTTQCSGPVAPGAPFNVSAASLSPGQAYVSFYSPYSSGGSPIQYYTAVSSPGNITATSSASPVVVNNLNTSGTSYTFTVSATNAAGTSSSSGLSNAATPESIQSYLTVSALAASSITTASAVLNGSITTGTAISPTQGFEYGLDTTYGTIVSSSNPLLQGPFSHTISGLSCSTTYHYRAYASDPYVSASSSDMTFTTSGCFFLGGGGGGGGGGSVAISPTPMPTITGTSTTVSPVPALATCSTLTSTLPPLPAVALGLAQGSRGVNVNNLQSYLVIMGYLPSQDITGYYGPLTAAAKVKYIADSTGSCTGSSAITPVSSISVSRLPAGFSFTSTLVTGAVSLEVKELQIFLNDQGFAVAKSGNGSYGHESTYFGPATKAALIKFQNAYAPTVLSPFGLLQGTGNFGAMTMKQANKILAAAL